MWLSRGHQVQLLSFNMLFANLAWTVNRTSPPVVVSVLVRVMGEFTMNGVVVPAVPTVVAPTACVPAE